MHLRNLIELKVAVVEIGTTLVFVMLVVRIVTDEILSICRRK